jgi:hypothetical protein
MNDSRESVLKEELNKLYVKREKINKGINENCLKLNTKTVSYYEDLKTDNSQEKKPEQKRLCEEFRKQLAEVEEEINIIIKELNQPFGSSPT